MPATGIPAAAARSAIAAPDEWPNTDGGSVDVAAATAARSSNSRSGANGSVSPLSPRPPRPQATPVNRRAALGQRARRSSAHAGEGPAHRAARGGAAPAAHDAVGSRGARDRGGWRRRGPPSGGTSSRLHAPGPPWERPALLWRSVNVVRG